MNTRFVRIRAVVSLLVFFSFALGFNATLAASAVQPEQAAGEAAEPTLQAVELANDDYAVDVVVSPDRFRAGDTIKYTYSYANLTNAPVANVSMDVTWTDFNRLQRCSPSPCEIIEASDDAIVRQQEIPGGIRVELPNMAPQGQAGSGGFFSIEILTDKGIYPQINSVIQQLASTGRLRIGEAPEAADTANASPHGPIFALVKNVAEGTPPQIYTGDTVDFVVTVTNDATDAEGKTRVEAIDATNVVIEDTVPVGAEFVPPGDDPDYSELVDRFTYFEDTRILRWELDELPINASLEIPVTFRRLDVPESCTSLNNNRLTVTSDEMPADQESTIKVPAQQTAAVAVVVPLIIETVRADPGSLILDPEAAPEDLESEIEIIIQSRDARAPIEGLQLIYTIQDNATYIAESASPELTDQDLPPEENGPGGTLTWNFTMPQAEVNDDGVVQPVRQTFTLRVRGLEVGPPTNGNAVLVLPDTIPAECIVTERGGGLTLQPVPDPPDILLAAKEVNLPLLSGNIFVGSQNQVIEYTVTLENTSEDQALTGLEMQDLLPTQLNPQSGLSRFRLKEHTYITEVVGISLPGYDLTDEDFFEYDEDLGFLIWDNVDIEPQETVVITYQVRINAEEYYDSCNRFEVLPETIPEDFRVNYQGKQVVCVKVNPRVSVRKHIVDNNGNPIENPQFYPGDDVRFELTVTNGYTGSLRLGLYDRMNQLLFVDAISGSNGYETTITAPEVNIFRGQMRDVAPDEELSLTFVGRLPESPPNNPKGCTSGAYVNEGFFLIDSTAKPDGIGRGEFIVDPLYPEADARLECLERQIEYSQAVRIGTTAALEDLVLYELRVRNRNRAEAVDNVTIEYVLPPKFTYVRLATEQEQGGNDATQDPAQSNPSPDGRTRLTWQVPSIEANDIHNVFFWARTSDAVGPAEGWMWATPPDTEFIAPRCAGTCEERSFGSEEEQLYATSIIQVKALHTIEPTLVQRECLAEGTPITYNMSMINTNANTEYTNVTLVMTLPVELDYIGVGDDTDEPGSVTGGSGRPTVVTWSGFTVPKPNPGQAVRKDFAVFLEVNQELEQLVDVAIQAISPDGLIPIKENPFDDSGVGLCGDLPNPDLGTIKIRKLVSGMTNPRVPRGENFEYRLVVTNINNFSVQVDIDDFLPPHFTPTGLVTATGGISYTSAISTTNPNARVLTWDNVSVAASSNPNLGSQTVILYQVRVEPASPPLAFYSFADVTEARTDTPDVTLEVDESESGVTVQVETGTAPWTGPGPWQPEWGPEPGKDTGPGGNPTVYLPLIIR